MIAKLSVIVGMAYCGIVRCENLQPVNPDVSGMHQDLSDSSMRENGRPSKSKSVVGHKNTLKFASAKRGAKHFDRHVAQVHLVSDDSSTTTSEPAGTDSPTTTETPATTTTTSTDSTTTTQTSTVAQFTGTWSTGEYGLCRANCGSGYKYRDLHCKDVSLVELDASMCDPALRPVSRQACEGDCLSCEVNSLFLKGLGVPGSPQTPLKVPLDNTDVLCRVESTSAVRCCTATTEAGIQVVVSQLKRGLTAQTQHRDVTIERIGIVYQNVTDVISARIDETSTAMDAIASAMDSEPSSLANADQTVALTNLRNGLAAALDMRTESLQVALSDVASAQDELIQQLDAMNSLPDDDTPPEDASSGDTDSLTNLFESFASGMFSADTIATEQSMFSDDDVGASLFMQMGQSDSTISAIEPISELQIHHDLKKIMPSFRESSFLEYTRVNFSDPTLRVASKQCQQSIESFFIGLSCSACNPIFPILAPAFPENPSIQIPSSQCTAMYTACSETLVAGHQHMVDGVKALLNSHSNLITVVAQVQPILDLVWAELRFDWLPGFSAQQVAKPDLTKMACIQELKVFQPYEVNTAQEFCNSYLSFASPKAFVKRVGVQIDRGVYAMAKFTSCDRCLHHTIMFLADVLGATAKGSLRVTLPTRTQAMISSCGATIPAPKVTSVALPKNAAKMTVQERISPRIFFAEPSVSLKAISYYANITQEILDEFASSPPHEWVPRSLVTDMNVTRQIAVSENTLKPIGPDAQVQIHVMNLNCTQHTDCYHQDAPSGMRPWWFCAHPNVCTAQPGACTAESLSLLADGPKCVRGPCMHDASAIDRVCPDNALCPSNGGASVNAAATPTFSQEYFARFDLKIRDQDPMMATTTKGVCDCAFGSNGAIIDQCEYARCLAYASLVEDKLTCNAELVNQCIAILKDDPTCAKDDTLDCTNADLILTYPPPLASECALSDFALSSDTSGATTLLVSSVLFIVVALC